TKNTAKGSLSQGLTRVHLPCSRESFSQLCTSFRMGSSSRRWSAPYSSASRSLLPCTIPHYRRELPIHAICMTHQWRGQRRKWRVQEGR
ncbi:hypothetical protein PMAYCL1PPCAC_01908, partial [Pristionchus mayeri]